MKYITARTEAETYKRKALLSSQWIQIDLVVALLDEIDRLQRLQRVLRRRLREVLAE